MATLWVCERIALAMRSYNIAAFENYHTRIFQEGNIVLFMRWLVCQLVELSTGELPQTLEVPCFVT